MPSEIIECCLRMAPEKRVEGPPRGAPVTVLTLKGFPHTQQPTAPPQLATGKEFIARESLLTEIFNTQHGSSLYRMCMVLSIITFCSSAAVDFVNNETLNIGQLILWKNVQGVPLTMVCWLVMTALVVIFYFGTCLWANQRSTSNFPIFWDIFFVLPVIVLTALFMALPAAAILLLSLAPVCSFGLLMEQVRFFTKTYAFLRAKVPHIRAGGEIPGFSHYFLFLVVPTLIYKDEYPRSEKVRWRLVLQHCLELVWAGVIISYCMARVHAPAISGFRSLWLDSGAAISTFVGTLVPTTLILLAGFFGYFHSFCNLQAELTGFQDRMFYKDWWNATSFKTFFTSWNTLVQDWLYHYVFADVRRMTGNPLLASCTVFLVSGIVHEYVLSFFFRFFYPVLVIVFVGAGLILKSIPTARVSPAFGNLTLWICIPIGSTIIVTSYMTEFFARRNCPYEPEVPFWVEFFVPRSWSCPMTS